MSTRKTRLQQYKHEWYIKAKEKPEFREHKAELEHNYRKNNRERIRQVKAIYRSNNRAKENAKVLRYYRRLCDKLITILGGRCVICGIYEDLQIDHIKGGGTAERRFFKTPDAMRRFYVKHPDIARVRLQALCSYHNIQKKRTLREAGRNYARITEERIIKELTEIVK